MTAKNLPPASHRGEGGSPKAAPPESATPPAAAKRQLAGAPAWVLPLVLLAVVGLVIWLVVFRESATERDTRLVNEARQAMQANDVATAEKRLLELQRRTPDSGLIAHNLGILYLKQGRQPEARQAFENAARLSPPTANKARAEELFQLAQISYGEKNWARAGNELERAIAADPTRVQLHARLLDLQLGRLQSPAAAESTTSRFLRLCGRTPQNLRDAAFIYYQRGVYDRSEALARQAVAMSDTLASAHSLVARSLWKTGRAPDGLKYLAGALQRNPRAGELWVARGGLLQSLSRSHEALAAADSAVAIDPKDYPSHQLRALALASEGRNEDALAELGVCRTLTDDLNELRRLAAVETNVKRALKNPLMQPGADSTGTMP